MTAAVESSRAPFIGETNRVDGRDVETLSGVQRGEKKSPSCGKAASEGRRKEGGREGVKTSQAAAKSVFGFSRHNGERATSLPLSPSVRWTAALKLALDPHMPQLDILILVLVQFTTIKFIHTFSTHLTVFHS